MEKFGFNDAAAAGSETCAEAVAAIEAKMRAAPSSLKLVMIASCQRRKMAAVHGHDQQLGAGIPRAQGPADHASAIAT